MSVFPGDESYRLSGVTEETVAEWAEGTLGVWLTGYTDRDEKSGEQYRIVQMTDDSYRVETVDAHVARVFRVSVIVEELT